MINQFFKTKFPFAYEYFLSALELNQKNKRNFPQAIIFEGSDTKSQFIFTLELACALNNINNNIKWIKTFSHPAVCLVSQLHFKNADDETKTTISTKQAKEIEKTLSLSSDYHRFFIFFSSKESDTNELAEYNFLDYGEFNYKIEPLTNRTFNPSAINALLKSIEEPPLNTTFVFLTKSKEDILPTIVSRCQTFKLSGNKIKIDYSDILNLFIYPITNPDIAMKTADMILENSQSKVDILNKILEYLKDNLKQNINNDLYFKIKNDINIVSDAIKHLSANMSEKIVIEAMCLKLNRGY